MNESDESLEWTSGWMKYVPYGLKHIVFFIACAITAPIGVVCLLGLCFYAGISNFVSEISFRRKMRRRGRFLARNELGSFIKGKGVGTLIIERPTPGWNFTHAWWAPEKLKEHGVPPVRRRLS